MEGVGRGGRMLKDGEGADWGLIGVERGLIGRAGGGGGMERGGKRWKGGKWI